MTLVTFSLEILHKSPGHKKTIQVTDDSPEARLKVGDEVLVYVGKNWWEGNAVVEKVTTEWGDGIDTWDHIYYTLKWKHVTKTTV